MAISKILYMKDSGKSYHGKSLKNAIEYITDADKTQGGKLVESLNCLVDNAFEQMKQTKQSFGKLDKRQGYHLILSFPVGEADANTAMEITRKFVKVYLGKEYEAIYSVHDNTDCVHSHIIFNSVSFMNGIKYRYEKGDWAKEIQPLMNRLCREYGLSELEFEHVTDKVEEQNHEWSVRRDGKFVWGDMIKRDLDACIIQASSMDGFLELLQEKGYEIKNAPGVGTGKYLAVKPPGMNRFKRCKTLGEQYSEEAIIERINFETVSTYTSSRASRSPRIVYCKGKRFRRAKLSGLQRKYYAKLYRTHRLKKKPYSQTWKYRDDIRKMQQIQSKYLFLKRHQIGELSELVDIIEELESRKKEALKEKSQVYRARSKCEELFSIAGRMKELKVCENSYQNGDDFFAKEHAMWVQLSDQLQQEGYSYDEVISLKQYYKEKYTTVSQKEKAIFMELKVAKSIIKELSQNEETREKLERHKKEVSRENEKSKHENTIEETKQPKR